MSRTKHPLDIELVDYVDGLLDAGDASQIEEHIAACLQCRIRRGRLSPERPIYLTPLADINVPQVNWIETTADVSPAAGQLWVTSGSEGLVVLVRKADDDEATVVPVVFDVEVADHECVVIPKDVSPLGTPIAIYRQLPVNIPLAELSRRVEPINEVDLLAADGLDGAFHGAAITHAADPRLEIRQLLTDHLNALRTFDEDAPEVSPRVGDLVSELFGAFENRKAIAERLEDLRSTYALTDAWQGVATVDQLDVRIVVIRTPAGIGNAEESNAAHQILIQHQGNALIVANQLAPESCELFERKGLAGAVSVADGQKRYDPLYDEMSVVDAAVKFLDQNARIPLSEASAEVAPAIDIRSTVVEQTSKAIGEIQDAGARAKIKEKVHGFQSAANVEQKLAELLNGITDGSFDVTAIAALPDEEIS